MQSPINSVPKAVVFDLGKVLVEFDYRIAADKIAAQSDLGSVGVRNMLDHAPLLFRYETGLINREQFYREVCSGAGYRGTLEEFSAHFADIFWEIPPMIALNDTLREHGVPTYIFSNTNGLAVNHIRNKFPFFSNFDGYVYSYQVGAMKPDLRIYEAMEKLCGKRGHDIVYIDDREENVAAGAARGWRTVCHESPEKTRVVLEKLLQFQPAVIGGV